MNREVEKRIESEIRRLVDERVAVALRGVDAIGRDVDTVSRQVAAVMSHLGIGAPTTPLTDEEGEPLPVASVDVTWACVRCGQRLGFYDAEQDVLRVRHKDHVLWVHVGLGGKVGTVCRGCGELNWVENEDRPESE